MREKLLSPYLSQKKPLLGLIELFLSNQKSRRRSNSKFFCKLSNINKVELFKLRYCLSF